MTEVCGSVVRSQTTGRRIKKIRASIPGILGVVAKIQISNLKLTEKTILVCSFLLRGKTGYKRWSSILDMPSLSLTKSLIKKNLLLDPNFGISQYGKKLKVILKKYLNFYCFPRVSVQPQMRDWNRLHHSCIHRYFQQQNRLNR